jgi:ABC-type lipoprotein release transport system permease subunit
MSGLLHDVRPGDPVTFTTVGLILTAVAFVASLVPAWRATRVDPVVALKTE